MSYDNIKKNNLKDNNSTGKKKISLTDAVKNYMSNNPLRILIGTPCFGGKVYNGYLQSMLDLTANFTKLGIPFEVMTLGSESLIPRARNGIVAKFMAQDENTHLMFIDADITFSWLSIIKLILMDKEMSGGCYPKKMINWDKIRHNLNKDEFKDKDNFDENLLLAKSVDYVFNPVYNIMEDNKMICKVENDMVRVKDLGTGFMLIKREVFDIMMYKYDNLKYKNNVAGYHTDDGVDYFYTLFDTSIDEKSRVYLSEDYLFCKRWRELGGDCWLDLSVCLNHTGSIDYKGAFGLTIGELDVLNKDFQLAQNQYKKNESKNNNELNNNELNNNGLNNDKLNNNGLNNNNNNNLDNNDELNNNELSNNKLDNNNKLGNNDKLNNNELDNNQSTNNSLNNKKMLKEMETII